MADLQSSLARHVASGTGDADPVRAKAAAAFHKDGVILLRAEWLANWVQQQQLTQLAEQCFGKRKARK